MKGNSMFCVAAWDDYYPQGGINNIRFIGSQDECDQFLKDNTLNEDNVEIFELKYGIQNN